MSNYTISCVSGGKYEVREGRILIIGGTRTVELSPVSRNVNYVNIFELFYWDEGEDRVAVYNPTEDKTIYLVPEFHPYTVTVGLSGISLKRC